ncbi:50S ribosomal protein L11 methyltransferase [Alcaligenaceae bacterium]|nr:50S ribosomal protein L11 methyltransferase [Alcaligenaceae bacterium]
MRELVLYCDEQEAEALSDALLQAGVLSVSVEDADGDTEHEQPLYGEPGLEPDVHAWHRNMVVALLPEDVDPVEILEHVRDTGGGNYLAADWTVREVHDADWVRLTQGQFGPIEVAGRIWIVPSWHRENPEVPEMSSVYQGQAGGVVRIELDPGLAFGTGSHPTTHLCLEWLAAHIQGNESLLDYGCGSGILAIAARKLGAGVTQAVDIDEQAVESTRYNAKVNGAQLQAMLPDELPDGQAQVVVANILSSPLKVLAPMLVGRVLPGGHLVLSGILERQTQEIIQAYAPWIELSVWRTRDDWVCMHGRKAD